MAENANIELHIDQITLHGFAPGDRRRIGDSLQRELTRLLREEGIPEGLRQPGRMERQEAPPILLEARAHPDAAGERIARSLYAAWKGEAES